MRLLVSTLAAVLAFASPAAASRIRVAHFDVAPNGTRTVPLPGSGAEVQLTSVRVNGHKLRVGDSHADGSATMYGESIVLRISQHGRRCSVRAASVGDKTVHVAVRFFYYADPR